MSPLPAATDDSAVNERIFGPFFGGSPAPVAIAAACSDAIAVGTDAAAARRVTPGPFRGPAVSAHLLEIAAISAQLSQGYGQLGGIAQPRFQLLRQAATDETLNLVVDNHGAAWFLAAFRLLRLGSLRP